MEKTRIPRLLPVALMALLGLLSSAAPAADTKEERVRKFQTSLGEQVVRDSGEELPADEKRSVLVRTVAAAAAGVALLAAASVLLARRRARKSEMEDTVRYLTENLLTPEAVRDHLARVADARTPLYLWIDDHFIKFSSQADGLRDGDEGLSILPVAPAGGNEMLRKSRTVRIEYLYQRVPYHLDTTWKTEEGDGGSFAHILAVPDAIRFTQRREHYRVEPPLRDAVVCRAVKRDLPEMGVLDVGMGGFSVATSARLRVGEEISPCRIEGGEMLPIELSARCVYEFTFPENTSKHRFRYGFAVTRLAEGNAKRLSRFITNRQLSELSHRKAMES